MTGEELKQETLRLAQPLREFLKANKVVSVFLPFPDGGEIKVSMQDKTPPEIKAVLEVQGSIYVQWESEVKRSL